MRRVSRHAHCGFSCFVDMQLNTMVARNIRLLSVVAKLLSSSRSSLSRTCMFEDQLPLRSFVPCSSE